MITPQANRSRMLYTIETRPTRAGELRGWLAPEAFAEFFPPLTEEEVTRELGRNKRLTLSTDGVDRFVEGLDRLFARVRSSVEESEGDGAKRPEGNRWLEAQVGNTPGECSRKGGEAPDERDWRAGGGDT